MLQDFYKKILHKTKFNPHLHCQDNNMPGSSENPDAPKNGRNKTTKPREPVTKTEQDCFGMEFPDECFHYSFKRKESSLKEL